MSVSVRGTVPVLACDREVAGAACKQVLVNGLALTSVSVRDSLPCNDRRACTVSYAAVARGVRSRQVRYRHRVLSGCSEPSAVPRYAVCHRRAAPHARGLVAPPPPHFVASPPMVIRHPDGTLLGSMVHVQLARDAIRSCTIHIQSRRLWLAGGWHKASRRSEGLQTIHRPLESSRLP